MRNIDEEIERILNGDKTGVADKNERVNFVSEGFTSEKNAEQLIFQDDNRQTVSNEYDHRDWAHLKNQEIFSMKPFSYSEQTDIFSNRAGINDQTGLFKSGTRQLVYDETTVMPRSTFKNSQSFENTDKQNDKEMNQFINDLLSNPTLEKQIKAHQEQTRTKALFEMEAFETPLMGNRNKSLFEKIKRDTEDSNRYGRFDYARMTPQDYRGTISGYNAINTINTVNSNNFTNNYRTLEKSESTAYRIQGEIRSENMGDKQRYDDLYGEKPIQASNATETLLFRTPVMHQSSFNLQGYSKTKRRRRISSSKWCTAGGFLAMHPSKLSSLEFVHGGIGLGGQSEGYEHNLMQKQEQTDGRMAESFKRQVNKLDFDNVTVYELKSIMKDYGLNPNGKKKEMIERIKSTLKELGTPYEEEKLPFIIEGREEPPYEKYFF